MIDSDFSRNTDTTEVQDTFADDLTLNLFDSCRSGDSTYFKIEMNTFININIYKVLEYFLTLISQEVIFILTKASLGGI